MRTRHVKQSKNTTKSSMRVKTAKWLHLLQGLGEGCEISVIDKADLNWAIYCLVK